MSHYFTNDDTLKSNRRIIKFEINNTHFELFSDDGVFSKDELDDGTKTLIETSLSLNLHGDILDLGCGTGTVGVVLKSLEDNISSIDLVDCNLRAVNLASINCDKLELTNVNVFESDIYKNVEKKYDFIITNPPIRAGKEIVNKFLLESIDHLKENGSLVVVMRKSHGAPSAMKKLSDLYGNVEILRRNKGFYIFLSRKS